MGRVFEDLLDELTPYGHQSVEIMGLDPENLFIYISDRALEKLKAANIYYGTKAADFFWHVYKCAKEVMKTPHLPKTMGH